VRAAIGPQDFESLGLRTEDARALAERLDEILRKFGDPSNPETQVRVWSELRQALENNPRWRRNFAIHLRLYKLAYADRGSADGPGPAWVPSRDETRASNLGRLMEERGFRDYAEFHRWSVEHREDFWATVIQKLQVRFRTKPARILDPRSEATHPAWLPGARLNIAESCFNADLGKAAIVHASEVSPDPRRVTYGELRRLSHRVANGLEDLGVAPGGRVALYMPMTPDAVAIYLGVILAGRVVVGIADASAAPDLAKRVQIASADAIFTIDAYVRDGKEHRVYEKVIDARAPRAVVLPREGAAREARTLRSQDIVWDAFLSDREEFEAVPGRPADPTNILFSSGTTKDPKAIPWTHTTPIKSAADAYLHHDVREADLLAWPTSFGWMMGPWLTYASLVNRAAMALYVGAPHRRDAVEFLSRAGATIVGVVPKLVRGWKAEGTLEGLDWSRVRLFSSTGEVSTPDEMLYLMSVAGYRPIIEYCGGTEIGGGYITGTVVQPCAPSTFTTPALGIDFRILEDGVPAPRGEVFLVPPSIGLSNDLLNYDHDQEYYAGVPRGPQGEILRRHGDRIEALGGGYYRHHGRIDDMINIYGVKTSAEEIRSVLVHDLVYDVKPAAVDVDGTGAHSLVVFAVPRDRSLVGSEPLRVRLRRDFEHAIKVNLNPLLAHVHDVVLVPELPQAGPGKTRTMGELRKDYLARIGRT